MTTIRMTMIQRLSLVNVLRSQRAAGEDLFLLLDIRNKIKVADPEQFIKELPDGRRLIDEVAIKQAEDVEVSFEKVECKRLLDILKTSPFGIDDLEQWIIPLRKQLEA